MGLYPNESPELPVLYVVRADGKPIYAKHGVPENLPVFLREYLRKSGAILNQRDLERMSKAFDTASRYYFDDDVPRAVQVIARYADSGSYAEPARRVDRLASQFVRRGRQQLSLAQTQLASSDETFLGAVTLMEVRRIYGKLPHLKKPLYDVFQQYKDNARIASLLEQAELIDQAKEKETEAAWAEAIGLYQQVAAKYPGTPGAALAQNSSERLASRTSAAADGGQSRKPTAEDRRKAASYLTLAKTFKDPEKVREYARKVLELLPADAGPAQEAQALLDDLDQ